MKFTKFDKQAKRFYENVHKHTHFLMAIEATEHSQRKGFWLKLFFSLFLLIMLGFENNGICCSNIPKCWTEKLFGYDLQ